MQPILSANLLSFCSVACGCGSSAATITADLTGEEDERWEAEALEGDGPDIPGDEAIDLRSDAGDDIGGGACKPGEKRCAGKSVEECTGNGLLWRIAQTCAAYQECLHGECVCLASCQGKECGSDSCGGSCGDCADGYYCLEGGGAATCELDCELLCGALECGDAGKAGECWCGSCDDTVACTNDQCGEDHKCMFTADDSACSDGVWCTSDLCDLAAGCISSPTDAPCDDGNPCTDDVCDPALGCSYANNNLGCDDGNQCTNSDVCGQGECIGALVVCDDGVACSVDSCDPLLGCTSQETDDLCDDGLACTDDSCAGGGCINSVQPFFCVVQGYCVPSGTENPQESCQKCLPLISQATWSAVEDKTQCGPGKRCFAGACCNFENNCEEKQCGDDGCGGQCGTCPGVQDACAGGQCVCVPKCASVECGPDGCGGSCGECASGAACGPDVACHCKEQYVCGDVCCKAGQVCFQGGCCTTKCQGKQCGDDGCGGACGPCPENTLCTSGTCVPGCEPGLTLDCDVHCFDEALWGDGKCHSGGMWVPDFACEALGWDGDDCCKPACDGKTCGSDGCGGSCGTCVAPEFCQVGACYYLACDDGNAVDWDGCTDGLVSEFQVNATTVYDQRRPMVTALQDGGFLVAWEGSLPEGNSTDAVARKFDGTGNAVGAEFLVNETTLGGQNPQQLIQMPTGGFGVVWCGGPAKFMIRPFTNDGSFAGQSFGLFGSIHPSADVIRVAAALEGGGFLIVGRKEIGTDFLYQVFDSSGYSLNGPAPVAIGAKGDQADISPTEEGGAVVAWRDASYIWGGKGEIYAQKFDAFGTKTGTSILVNEWTEGPQTWPSVHGLKGGRFLVTWHSQAASSAHSGTFLRVFEATGDPAGEEVQVRPGDLSRSVFSALPDGRVVAVWGVTFALLDENGVVLTNGNSLTPAGVYDIWVKWTGVASFADSSFVAVWQNGNGQDGDGMGIFAQIFNPDGTVKPKK